MNRLKEIEPKEKGIIISKKKLITVQGGACDFYEIGLAKQPESSVIFSIRASLGAVFIRPDTVHLQVDDWKTPQRVVVISDPTTRATTSEFELVHYVTSRAEHLDGLTFKMKVFVVEREGGTLSSFGANGHFQLGHHLPGLDRRSREGPDTVPILPKFASKPQDVTGLPPKAVISQMDGGEAHTCVVFSDGVVYAWGDARHGALGHYVKECDWKRTGVQRVEDAPVVIRPLKIEKLDQHYITQVACGAHHTLALTFQGDVFSFGCSDNGRLGQSDIPKDTIDCCQPRIVCGIGKSEGGKPVTQISCGYDFSSCLTQNYEAVYTWGAGHSGAIAQGRLDDSLKPKQVQGIDETSVLQIACGRYHMALLTQAGEILTVGYGANGRLGHDSDEQLLVPKRVDGPPLCRLVASGGAHTGVLDQDLNVWMWGSNECGQLGLTFRRDSKHSFESVPRKLLFFQEKGVCTLHLGARHSCALTLYGLVYTWGAQDAGQLGQGDMSTDALPLPRAVDALMHRPVVQIVGCDAHTLAISVFEYPTADTPKFDAWKQSVQKEDDKRRKKADKAFLKFVREEGKDKTKQASAKWLDHQAEHEEKKSLFKERRQEAAQKVIEQKEIHRQAAAHGACGNQQKMLARSIVHKKFLDGSEAPEGFDVNFVPACIKQAKGRDRRADEEREDDKIWKPIDFEPVIKEEPDHRARRSTIRHVNRALLAQMTMDKKVETVARLGFNVFGISANSIDEDNMSIDNGGKVKSDFDDRQISYFEPPEIRSRSGAIQAFLRPSDLIEQSAASVFLANPQKAVQQDTWVLSPNPCLAPALMEGSHHNHFDSYAADDGGTLEEPRQSDGSQAGQLQTVTLFGEFFTPEDIGLHRSLGTGQSKQKKIG